MSKLLALAALGAGLVAFADGAHCQTAYLEDSSISGFGRSITIAWLPVETAEGKIVYRNVVIPLAVDAEGNLTYATTKPSVTVPPSVTVVGLRPGPYVLSTDSNSGFTIKGPSPLPGGAGVGQWTTNLTNGQNAGGPVPATFYTGPLANMPDGIPARVAAAKIPAKQYVAFGIVQQGAPGFYFTNDLFGIAILGNQINIVDFTCGGGADHAISSCQQLFNFN